MYLEFVPGDLNPADNLFQGGLGVEGAGRRGLCGGFGPPRGFAIFPTGFTPQSGSWVSLNGVEGRRGAAHNLDEVALGSAEPQV